MRSERGDLLWLPTPEIMKHIDVLIPQYRNVVTEILETLVQKYYPSLIENPQNEYRKMIELSTKMTIVGYACSAISGYTFDERRQRLSALYGGCCFLADSFIDDFGEQTTKEYLKRLELLLSKGWFSIHNEREQLFYIILIHLFYERDILDPLLRQAIMLLFLAQKRDVELRFPENQFHKLSRIQQLHLLEECARNRGGHTSTALSSFLVPDISLQIRALIFSAGVLFMHIDDHGDHYSDLYHNRVTYMNQARFPLKKLQRIFENTMAQIYCELPAGEGRDIMIGFLYRYYVTRIKKHILEKNREKDSWAVYE
jgi:hypothetical protein